VPLADRDLRLLQPALPICYAESGPERQQFRSLEQIEFMLDAVVRNEGKPDVVQISGGEPTMHPGFFKVIELAKARPSAT